MKLTTLAKLLSTDITISRTYEYRGDGCTGYRADIDSGIEFKTSEDGGILESIYGFGDTELEALQNLADMILEYKFAVYNAYSSKRKMIKLPDEKIEIDL